MRGRSTDTFKGIQSLRYPGTSADDLSLLAHDQHGAPWLFKPGLQGRLRGYSRGASLWVGVFSLSSLPCMLA
ncbi:hypothetical protein K6106_19840 [Pseudomonas fluorescens]|nr:hypothetical protein K6106_19840 [Pseudomonas fluorescens]